MSVSKTKAPAWASTTVNPKYKVEQGFGGWYLVHEDGTKKLIQAVSGMKPVPKVEKKKKTTKDKE